MEKGFKGAGGNKGLWEELIVGVPNVEGLGCNLHSHKGQERKLLLVEGSKSDLNSREGLDGNLIMADGLKRLSRKLGGTGRESNHGRRA